MSGVEGRGEEMEGERSILELTVSTEVCQGSMHPHLRLSEEGLESAPEVLHM